MASPARAFRGLNSDVALGAGLAVVGVAESFTGHPNVRLLTVLIAVLLGLGIASARWSLWVPVVVTAVLLPALPMAGVSLNASFVPLLAIVLAAYLAAARGRKRQRAAMLAMLLVAVGVGVLTDTRPVPSNLLFAAMLVIGPALAGAAVATRQRLVSVLEERTSLLEQQQASQAAAAVAAERLRIARELHDIVAHSLSVMALQAGAVRRHLSDQQRGEREMLLAVESTGRSALEDMHRMLRLLRSGELTGEADRTPQPGLARLDELARDAGGSGLEVTIRRSGDLSHLPAMLELTAFRIVQEALTNVRKHANASRAEVCITSDGHVLAVHVADNGTPSSPRLAGAGLGLIGMRERVAVNGGELAAGPREDGPGFLVRASLPITPDTAAP